MNRFEAEPVTRRGGWPSRFPTSYADRGIERHEKALAATGVAGQDWRNEGDCVGEDPRLWDLDSYADDPAVQDYAAGRLCGGCPVVSECLDALTRPHGRGFRYYGVIMGGVALRGDPDEGRRKNAARSRVQHASAA